MADTLGFGDLQNAFAGNTTLTASQSIQAQKMSVPRLTTTQRDALAGADLVEGTIIYNTTTHKLNVRVAAAWEAITSA